MEDQGNTLQVGSQGLSFAITMGELADIFQARLPEALEEYGGVDGIAKCLRTHTEQGLSLEEEAQGFDVRIEMFGDNTHPEPPHTTYLQLVWNALHDTTLMVLMVAAVVSLLLGLFLSDEGADTGWIEGTAILIAVVLVVNVSAANDYNKEKQFRSLKKDAEDRPARVVRGGEQYEVSVLDLQVGDIVLLDTGDKIPADGLFVDGNNLRMDESVMTGETDMVKKNTGTPFILSGCTVSEGIGRMMVTAVGVNSEWGLTMSRLAEERDDTPLQQKLTVLARDIGKLGLGAAILVFLALFIRFVISQEVNDEPWRKDNIQDILDFLIIAVTIVVVAIPEGLPLAVTISLAYSMRKMMKDNNLVRHLEACETMGGATNICSDKTGTLTENRMTVVQLWACGTFYSKVPVAMELPASAVHLLTEGISVNSNAYVHLNEDDNIWHFVGNKTECALLVLAHKLGCDWEDVRKKSNVITLFTFSSLKKRMSTIVSVQDEPDYPMRLHTKGASEIVLDLCTRVLNASGDVEPLTTETRSIIRDSITGMASSGLRTLCIACRNLGGEEWKDGDDAPEEHLTCIAVVGIKDPVRMEVPDAVECCQRAGITVRMVTGDNILTAKHIARECGILTDDGIAMEGPHFRTLEGPEMDAILPKLQVLARSSPIDKYTLVHRLRELGEVVAVTGDGTNDAPALKEADVGLAMGLSGTEVAKEASDIIILDDNFSSIVKSVMWGRSVYDNIRKFLQFQLTVNVVALSVAFIGAVSEEQSPLTAVQLLWVNLIMDTFAALALGTEPPTLDLLNRKPYGRRDRLISNRMWRNIFGQAGYHILILLLLVYLGNSIFDTGKVENSSGELENDYTLVFNTFVLLQLFNEINSRKVFDEMNVFEGITKNMVFWGVISFTLIVQVLITQFGGDFTNSYGLDGFEWGASIVLGVLVLPWGYIVRLIPTPPEKERKLPTDSQAVDSKPSEDTKQSISQGQLPSQSSRRSVDISTQVELGSIREATMHGVQPLPSSAIE